MFSAYLSKNLEKIPLGIHSSSILLGARLLDDDNITSIYYEHWAKIAEKHEAHSKLLTYHAKKIN